MKTTRKLAKPIQLTLDEHPDNASHRKKIIKRHPLRNLADLLGSISRRSQLRPESPGSTAGATSQTTVVNHEVQTMRKLKIDRSIDQRTTLQLTLDAQTRRELRGLAALDGVSPSELVKIWTKAECEARGISSSCGEVE